MGMLQRQVVLGSEGTSVWSVMHGLQGETQLPNNKPDQIRDTNGDGALQRVPVRCKTIAALRAA